MAEHSTIACTLPRRALLLSALGGALPLRVQALAPRTLVFPRDHGSHPDFRTEWWYITGQALAGTPARMFGFQLTFFRSRLAATQDMRSQFAARQLVFAHAALTDVQGRTLLHDQRVARQGFDIAKAAEADTAITLRDWSLVRDGREGGAYRAQLPAEGFALDLRIEPTQPVLLQGERGLSRKGPEPAQASYYYSQPQLRVQGSLTLRGQQLAIAQGRAWADHEWSQELLHPQAVGWDWIGMNLDDGSALTAFRLRDRQGQALWDGGSFRAAGGQPHIASRGEVVFSPQRSWKSPRTQATYPIEWRVRTPADIYTVKAVLDDQELDSRASTGAVYWEGLSDLLDSNGRHVGRGYLEMTGYARALRL